MPGSWLESVYYRLPVAAQHLAFSAHGIRLKRVRYGGVFRAKLASLKESQWWSSCDITKYKQERLINLLRHAVETVPFYREFYGDHGIRIGDVRGLEDLERLPILTKALVRENQERLVSQAFPRRALVTGLTSGTTGTPLKIRSLPSATAFQWAVWWRHKERFGLHPGDRHLMLGARMPARADDRRCPWRHDYANRRTYLSTSHLTRDVVESLVQLVNSQRYRFITGYPSAIAHLCQLVEEAGEGISSPPAMIITGSDSLTQNMVEDFRRVFRCPTSEQYGMAEFAGNLSKCELGVFHEDFECCHTELLPLTDGSTEGRLLFTGWGNPAMPFIRYDVGDIGERHDGCACGRQSVAFRKILGRSEDYIITADGRKLTGMNQVVEYATHAREIQIVQRAVDVLEIRVVPGPGFGDSDTAALHRELDRRLGCKTEIKFAIVESIPRGENGKFKGVVNLIGGG